MDKPVITTPGRVLLIACVFAVIGIAIGVHLSSNVEVIDSQSAASTCGNPSQPSMYAEARHVQ